MLLPRADIAREALPEELRKAGAEVDDIAAYRTIRASWGSEGEPDIYKKLLEGDVDIVTFTSASSVRHFVTNHCRQASLTLRHRQNSGIHHNFTARQAKRIHLGAAHETHLPIEIPPRAPGSTRNPLGNTANHVSLRSALDDLGT